MSGEHPQDDVRAYLRDRSNWNRWGADDEVGALNLIDNEKRVAAAGLVRSGHVVSLARRARKVAGPATLEPMQHFVQTYNRPRGAGTAADYFGMSYHGVGYTHMDALCHVWDEHGMWNGRDPSREVQAHGSRWAGIDNWADGLTTRGVLFDVPRYRGADFIEADQPIAADELFSMETDLGLDVRPGDAIVVCGGRESWEEHYGPFGAREIEPTGRIGAAKPRPGLDGSCVTFIRERDCAALVWDMLDVLPGDPALRSPVHAVINAFGVALIDNALLEPLTALCAELGRTDFLLTAAPLRIPGATGSPVNPLALL